MQQYIIAQLAVHCNSACGGFQCVLAATALYLLSSHGWQPAAHQSPALILCWLGVRRCVATMQLLWRKAVAISPACSLPALTMAGRMVSPCADGTLSRRQGVVCISLFPLTAVAGAHPACVKVVGERSEQTGGTLHV